MLLLAAIIFHFHYHIQAQNQDSGAKYLSMESSYVMLERNIHIWAEKNFRDVGRRRDLTFNIEGSGNGH